MYTSYINHLEKNQMMTPPTIGLTSSIVNDKLSNITLEDNSSGLFTMNEDKSAIKTKDGVPLEASQFKITPTNEGNNDKFALKIYYSPATKTNHLEVYQEKSSIITFNKDHVQWNVPFGFAWNKGFKFNTNIVGSTSLGAYPSGYLQNLVPSDVTETQMARMTKDAILDNVCPTYKYCDEKYAKTADVESNYVTKTYADGKYATYQFTENTYAKKSEVSTNLAWNSFSVYTTDGDDFKKQLSNISIKIAGSHITIPIPTDINSTNLIMSVDFTVRSTNKTALNALGCTLNSLSGSSTSQSETETRASVFSGYTTKGTCIRTNSPYEYKFSLICSFSTTRHKKAYLHFFFDDNVNYTASDEIYILATKTEPQVNVTIFGI